MTNPNEITPNVVITNPDTRRRAGVVLYLLLIAAGVASLALGFFPELSFGSDVVGRLINFVVAAVTFLSAGFGLKVTTPNVPRI